MVNDPEIAELLRKIDERGEIESSAFNEKKTVGTESQEAATTTLPPNSRFTFIKNGKHLNEDEVSNDVTFDPPLYRVTLTPGDVWVVRGAERNAYTPGFEAVGGSASQSESLDNKRIVPEGITFETGYADLTDQQLSSTAIFTQGDKDGFALHLTNDVQELRTYKSSDVDERVPRDNWQLDIIDDDDFEWDLSELAVKRWVFDLYGAGEGTLFVRLRSTEENAKYVKVATVSDKSDPILTSFNLPVSTRVELADDAPENVDFFFGPKQFLNRKSDAAEVRVKPVTYRNVNINDEITAGTNESPNYTVIRVYRIDPEKIEASTLASNVSVVSPNTDAQVDTREVHPDWVNFPAGFDESLDSNWRAPGTQNKRETSVEEAELSSGQATLETYTDSDGVTKPRGELTSSTSVSGGGGQSSSEEKSTELNAFQSEYNYVLLLGKAGSTNSDIKRIVVRFDQRW